jgi:hypothetical protein
MQSAGRRRWDTNFAHNWTKCIAFQRATTALIHIKRHSMKRMSILALAAVTAAGVTASVPFTAGRADDESSPIFGVKIPAGYRQWKLVAVAHESELDELRGVLGNTTAMKAYQDGTLPYPDGTILAKLAWKHVPLAEIHGAFVTGSATTVQIMIKDSKKYAATGGWGFGRFIGGKPVDEAQHKTCFACHEANVKGHDFVFTRLAP